MWLIFLALAALGFLVGWLTGASNSPVIAALLPLVFALLGTLGISFAGAVAHVKAAQETLSKGGFGAVARAREILAKGSTVNHPTASAGALVLFCTFCFLGLLLGERWRIPVYPSLRELIPAEITMTHREAAALHRFRLALQGQRVRPSELREIFTDSIVPFFRDPNYREGGELAELRDVALKELLADFANTPKQTGRGPSSTGKAEIFTFPENATAETEGSQEE